MKNKYANRIPMSMWADSDIPSNKLIEKGTGSLSDAELLSIMITNGIQGDEALDISRQILAKCHNLLTEFWKLSAVDLQAYEGIGMKKAIQLQAMFELSRRRNESEVLQKKKITSSKDAFEVLNAVIGDINYEEFWVLILNKANRIIRKVRVSEGGVSGTVVDPKKVYKMALDSHASSLVLGHNHPSGNLQPSEADHKITKKLKDAGILLDIAVLDHIIVAQDRYYSFADEGVI